MIGKKTISALAIGLSAFCFSSLANATVVTYNDRVSFEAAITDIIIDDFNGPEYDLINTAADMKSLSAGSIGYESTFHNAPDWNIISGNYLCWGCNGSGQIILDDTSIGSASGVFGFGLDILGNSSYDAFVTYGDGTTQNFDLGFGAAFFGLTSDDLIKQVHFGLANGGSTSSGNFSVDNVTIGNSTGVPEPASLGLIGLGLAGLLMARRRRI